MILKDLLIALYAFSLFFITSFIVAPLIFYRLSEDPLDFTILPFTAIGLFKVFLLSNHAALAAGVVISIIAITGVLYLVEIRRQK